MSTMSMDFGTLDVHAIALDVAGVAQLIAKEDKIDEWKGWGSE
ncbi:hypothetical protein [Pseudomonas sp. Marseille-P9899]|nr:hypothetical protein [Pseudomonas sp. Marseille-P9899]